MNENQNKDESIIETFEYGYIRRISTKWNDLEDLGKKEIIKMKIIKIKVYIGLYDQKKVIFGISTTFKNLITGEIKETLPHKGSLDFLDIKEFVIGNDEYLTDFYIQFPFFDLDYILQIGYGTNKRKFLVPEKSDEVGENKYVSENGRNNIIIGTFGHFSEKLDATGCFFVPKKDYMKFILFSFFMLRHKSKNDAQFKEEWDKKYKNIPIEYQYIWKFINLDEKPFKSIIKYCFI